MWLTVGPHWIHDGIYPDSAIPGKLTVRILLLIQGVAWIIVCGKVVFSLITTYVLIQRVGPPKILRILCSGLLREMVSVEFFYLSFLRGIMFVAHLQAAFVEQADYIHNADIHCTDYLWATFAICPTRRGRDGRFWKTLLEIKYCLPKAQPQWEVSGKINEGFPSLDSEEGARLCGTRRLCHGPVHHSLNWLPVFVFRQIKGECRRVMHCRYTF